MGLGAEVQKFPSKRFLHTDHGFPREQNTLGDSASPLKHHV